MAKHVGSGNSLTYTEVHAAILGAVVGVLSGCALSIGRTTAAVGLASFFVGVTLGIGGSGTLPAAQRTVRREPWYALAALVVGGVASVAVLGGGTAMA